MYLTWAERMLIIEHTVGILNRKIYNQMCYQKWHSVEELLISAKSSCIFGKLSKNIELVTKDCSL